MSVVAILDLLDIGVRAQYFLFPALFPILHLGTYHQRGRHLESRSLLSRHFFLIREPLNHQIWFSSGFDSVPALGAVTLSLKAFKQLSQPSKTTSLHRDVFNRFFLRVGVEMLNPQVIAERHPRFKTSSFLIVSLIVRRAMVWRGVTAGQYLVTRGIVVVQHCHLYFLCGQGLTSETISGVFPSVQYRRRSFSFFFFLLGFGLCGFCFCF